MRNGDKPISSLFADLARETGDLVQQEVRLARAEINEKISQMNTGITSLITGGVVVLAGLLVLLQAVVFGVAELISPWTDQAWVAPLIVGVIVTLIGIAVLQKGRHNLKPAALRPERSAESLKRDTELLRGQFK
jgi:putative exporter of polyketide antibiotics